MRTGFGDGAVFDAWNTVGAAYGADSVDDHDQRFAAAKFADTVTIGGKRRS